MSKKIVFVDDDHGPMDMYVDALRDAGFEVDHIDSLPEALEHLEEVDGGRRQFADLYVLDIMMPAMRMDLLESTNSGLTSGIYLLEKLLDSINRKKGALDRALLCPHVIMLTAVSNPAILQKIKESHGVEVLAKLDVLPSELAEKSTRILS